ncbi:MAG TPA: protein translocase subunit SecF [Candidatus Kapabacteria bacterium]|nr:protein translocase subunit SecF [Candidatus Kapabacteria bacterium]
MQFFKTPNIDFVGKRKLFTILSVSINILALVVTLIFPPPLGIDFKGGAEMGIEFKNNTNISQLRDALDKSDLSGIEIKSYGASNQFLVRIPEAQNSTDQITELLSKEFGDNYKIIKVDKIGPKIGSEMFANALWAVLFSVIAMLLYIAFRFDFAFGVGAIVALVHDVLFTFGMIVLVHHLGILNMEVDQGFIAGILTVVGYSVNDTVVIFDRIRENAEIHKGLNYFKLVNMSINEVLSRTLNTGMTTLGVLLIFVFMGGPVLQSFSFIMFIGIVIGTYSSIFVASNFVIWYHTTRKEKINTNLSTAK